MKALYLDDVIGESLGLDTTVYLDYIKSVWCQIPEDALVLTLKWNTISLDSQSSEFDADEKEQLFFCHIELVQSGSWRKSLTHACQNKALYIRIWQDAWIGNILRALIQNVQLFGRFTRDENNEKENHSRAFHTHTHTHMHTYPPYERERRWCVSFLC